MTDFYRILDSLLGLHLQGKELDLGQTLLRAAIVFIVSLVMIRVASKRFLSKMTAFDALLGFVLASMLARAVNGSASFFPTLAGGFLLVAMHRFTAYLACKSHRFGNLVKGHCIQVIREGKIIEPAMNKHNLTEHDLKEEMRLNGNVEEVAKVKAAYLERSGKISVVREE